MAKYAEKLYEGRVLVIDGIERAVTGCDYEPPDPSVGIFNGCLMISCSDDSEWTVWDDGSIHDAADRVVGHGPELVPDEPLYD